jgi:hypothetical protein
VLAVKALRFFKVIMNELFENAKSLIKFKEAQFIWLNSLLQLI